MLSMNRGVALLEQYQYLEAFKVFEKLATAYPDWLAAHVNKGISAFNLQDEYLKVAEASFRRALELDPKEPHALLSLAILYNYTQRLDQALELMAQVVQIDPQDPHALFHYGVFLFDTGQVDKARAVLEKVLKLQPAFASAYYRLMTAYLKSGEGAKRKDAARAFSRLQEAKVGVLVGNKYGENGKYNCAIRGSAPPGWKGEAPSWTPPAVPRFGPVETISSRPAVVRKRPDGKLQMPAFAVGDLNGDGSCEVVLCGQTAAEGARPDTVVYASSPPATEGGGSYRQVARLERDAVVCALGDVDSDGDSDLILAATDTLEIFRNDGKGRFAEETVTVEKGNHRGFPVRLYCADIDSDWDLDIVCLRQEKGAGGKVQSRLELINNNRNETFTDISVESGFEVFDFPAAEVVVGDLDGDVDADLLVLDGESGRPYFFENERLWRYSLKEDTTALRAPGAVSLAGGDADGDGDLDLIVLCGGVVHLWKNEGQLHFDEDRTFRERCGATGGKVGVAADFLGALRLSLILLDPSPPPAAGGKGAAGGARPVFMARIDTSKAVRLEMPDLPPAGAAAAAVVTIVGKDSPPALIVYDTKTGAQARSLELGRNWVGLCLEGSKKPVEDKERANLSGIGATVEIRCGVRSLLQTADTDLGGTARAPARVFSGLAGAATVDQTRILWPDAVLQSETGLVGGRVHRIAEIERKPTSCPMLFVWNGEKYEFVADFLGVGGLGYFELPGVYSQPDPTEYLLVDSLKPRDGFYDMEILEPLEECTYLDEFKLTVVDHPADVRVVPDEMFAVAGPAPGFHLLGYRHSAFPVKATREDGADVTGALLRVDRRYGNRFQRDPRFPGLSRSTHAIELDFGDRLGKLLGDDPQASAPYLVLHGFVEYGYSTSNFAAWQAREAFHAPTVKVRRKGSWVALREEWGFPGGYPRYMTVDLGGCLRASDRALRVETNMDIHWDQAFLINADAQDELRVTDLEADVATLAFKGFPPDEPSDGSIPRIVAFRDFDSTAPIKVFPGSYTRYGDVRELLSRADDRHVLFGPGEGISLRFRADRLPPLRRGSRRTLLAKTFGYCKDTDLYTAHPDRVEPLPFRGMSGYPFRKAGAEEAEAYPDTPFHRRYLREWNTRVVEGTLLDPIEDLPKLTRSR